MEGSSFFKVSVGFRTFSHFQISPFNKLRLKAIVPFDFFLQPRLLRNNSFEKWPLKLKLIPHKRTEESYKILYRNIGEIKVKLFLQHQEGLSCRVASLMSVQKVMEIWNVNIHTSPGEGVKWSLWLWHRAVGQLQPGVMKSHLIPALCGVWGAWRSPRLGWNISEGRSPRGLKLWFKHYFSWYQSRVLSRSTQLLSAQQRAEAEHPASKCPKCPIIYGQFLEACLVRSRDLWQELFQLNGCSTRLFGAEHQTKNTITKSINNNSEKKGITACCFISWNWYWS